MRAALNNFVSFMVQLLVFGLEPSSDPVLKWASTGLDFNWYQEQISFPRLRLRNAAACHRDESMCSLSSSKTFFSHNSSDTVTQTAQSWTPTVNKSDMHVGFIIHIDQSRKTKGL